jgi:hypothetical protein
MGAYFWQYVLQFGIILFAMFLVEWDMACGQRSVCLSSSSIRLISPEYFRSWSTGSRCEEVKTLRPKRGEGVAGCNAATLQVRYLGNLHRWQLTSERSVEMDSAL